MNRPDFSRHFIDTQLSVLRRSNESRFTEEFKTQAVKQVTEQGYSVASVSDRLGMSTHSLYAWIKKYGPQASHHQEDSDPEARIRQLEKELKRVT